jgi:hypothetical protein
MIGVIANSSDSPAVREFFELFKTPWEFYQPDRKYDVIVCAGAGDFDESAARLVVIYSALTLPMDATESAQLANREGQTSGLEYKGFRIPIYGNQMFFSDRDGALAGEGFPFGAISQHQVNGTNVVRVGYDLFEEVRALLTSGQPSANAAIPALELHIALLRDLIVTSGIPLAEIPPVPDGYRFIACLTHDVDHPMMRAHKFDPTMFGFLFRAILGTLGGVITGHRPWRDIWTNWGAAFQLPLVHLGLAKDRWAEIDRYIAMEDGARSSFFVIPFAGRPGRHHGGAAPSARAARYGAADLSEQIRNLISADCEVGLHGIDAWLDSDAAARELGEVRSITGCQEVGVRMHWLYFDAQSPATLERAGASYDSTVGYNETIGYRAGTTQAYKPLSTRRLIELPLHIMDTALFFPSYLNLPPGHARKRVGQMVDDATRFGGCLTINWHDRSIAPERLWGKFYADLVAELKARGAWLATAGQTVAWFRKRRAAVFENVNWDAGVLRAQIGVEAADNLPSLQLRVHDGSERHHGTVTGRAPLEFPSAVAGDVHLRVAPSGEVEVVAKGN